VKQAKTPSGHVTERTVRQWLAQGVPWDEIIRRIEADRITTRELRGWFDLMPNSAACPLTDDALEKLARDIAHLREAGWPHTLAEERERRLQRVERAGQDLAAAIEFWSELQPPGHKFAQLQASLIACGFSGIDRPPMVAARPPGQPRAAWHKWGREFAILLKRALREAGYPRIAETDENSAVAVVGAAIISRAFDKAVLPSGFASAMRVRDRSAKGRLSLDAILTK
jgi:hypothetical protein